jgi:hypothetical protein
MRYSISYLPSVPISGKVRVPAKSGVITHVNGNRSEYAISIAITEREIVSLLQV